VYCTGTAVCIMVWNSCAYIVVEQLCVYCGGIAACILWWNICILSGSQ